MARQSRRMSPSQIAEDEETYAALKAIANYTPANSAYTLAAVEQAYQELQAARTAEVQADAAAKAASDNVVEKQATFHDLIIGARDQVTAQFGRNSDQAQSVGRKKPSDTAAQVEQEHGRGRGRQVRVREQPVQARRVKGEAKLAPPFTCAALQTVVYRESSAVSYGRAVPSDAPSPARPGAEKVLGSLTESVLRYRKIPGEFYTQSSAFGPARAGSNPNPHPL